MPHTSESLQAAFKYLFIEEVHALKELAQSLPANPVVVNIGAGAGTSGLAFMESRPDLYLCTIDTEENDSPLGSLYSEEQVLRQAGLWSSTEDNIYPVRIKHLCGDSEAVGLSWHVEDWDSGYKYYPLLEPFVDLVFIDGDHSYNGCKGDILAWLPNIKTDGIMAVHDFGKREVYKNGPIDNAPHPLPWPGVDRAVRRYLCPYFEMILKVKTLVAFRVK